MARELLETDWIKLEVIANDDTLQPDLFGLVEAAGELTKRGFKVFPYTTEDLSAAERLVGAGCRVLMPWGSPIGSARGLSNPHALRTLRAYFPDLPLVIDAGIGAPSHASGAMEMGYDAVLLNTAVAKAHDPVAMAKAFADAIDAGRAAFAAGLIEASDRAHPSTPVAGTAFFDLGPAKTRDGKG
jgi:thiazole synthase